VRALFWTTALALLFCGEASGASKANKHNCDNSMENLDAGIAACTTIINANDRAYGVVIAYNNRGNAYYQKGEIDLALSDYNQALRLDPQYAIGYYNRGNVHKAKGASDRAIADYDQAIRINPNYTSAYNNRCWTYDGLGQYARAVPDCNQALRLDPKHRNAYNNRCWAYNGLGQFDLALPDCTETIRLDPQFAHGYNNRCWAYNGKGQYDRAIADCDQALRIDPKNSGAYYNRGVAYHRKGDLARAISDYDGAIRLFPNYANAYYNRGEAYHTQGDHARAISDYDQAIRLNSSLQGAFNSRGWLKLQTGQREEARADADRAVALNPADYHSRDTRGHVHLTMGNTQAALDDFNEALRVKPDFISSLWGRGQIYEQQGLRSLAFADYKKAIELKASGKDETAFQNQARARLVAIDTGRPASAAPVETAAKAPPPARPLAPIGRRVALVIGNSAYKSVTALPNPKNDAMLVAAELTRVGFEVIQRYDLGGDDMRHALGEFEDKATGAEWALVYYAGHGMELSGKNWLIPVDAKLQRSSDMADEAVPLDRVLERLSVAKTLRIVVLDACRNNPFVSRMVMNRATRAVARGLTAVDPSHGEVVFYAARDGSTALDGTGANSPFASAFVKHIEEPGVELGRFFRKVTSSVLEATGNQQEPFVYGRIPDADYYFKPPG
jgi:tetratricopeptide (TPR) repeat protein